MLHSDAIDLIQGAVPRSGGTWADFGAGDGTFTRALASLLEPGSRIYAVDKDRGALSWTARSQHAGGVQIIPVVEDFARAFDVGDESRPLLDGMLFANSLHFVEDPVAVLRRLTPYLRPGSRIVLVEYDQRGPNQWIPHPIPISALAQLTRDAGLRDATVTGSRPSQYRGMLYAAAIDKE